MFSLCIGLNPPHFGSYLSPFPKWIQVSLDVACHFLSSDSLSYLDKFLYLRRILILYSTVKQTNTFVFMDNISSPPFVVIGIRTNENWCDVPLLLFSRFLKLSPLNSVEFNILFWLFLFLE